MRNYYTTGSAALLVLLPMIFVQCESPDPLPTNTPSSAARTAATASTSTDYVFDEADALAKGWTREFNEDFTGSLSQWNAWSSGAFNNELQYYQPANITFVEGIMRITAVKETKTGATHPWDSTPKTFEYTSGRIESKALFTPTRTKGKVRVMARIKLPYGNGMWPAFWTYGDSWPTNGEIDILEAKGHEPLKYATNYFYGRRANVNLVRNAEKTIYPGPDLTAGFHVYELVWTKDALIFYFDGVEVDRKTGDYVPNLFGKKERITLNLAVGGDYFGPLDPSTIQTGTLEVDWVKVFTAP